MRTSFQYVGKGWFNLHESNWEVYRISKLRKYMEMVKFCMQDSLRYLVQDSLVSFTHMVLDACIQVMDCVEDMDWGKSLTASQYKPKKYPLFVVDLLMGESKSPRLIWDAALSHSLLIDIQRVKFAVLTTWLFIY